MAAKKYSHPTVVEDAVLRISSPTRPLAPLHERRTSPASRRQEGVPACRRSPASTPPSIAPSRSSPTPTAWRRVLRGGRARYGLQGGPTVHHRRLADIAVRIPTHNGCHLPSRSAHPSPGSSAARGSPVRWAFAAGRPADGPVRPIVPVLLYLMQQKQSRLRDLRPLTEFRSQGHVRRFHDMRDLEASADREPARRSTNFNYRSAERSQPMRRSVVSTRFVFTLASAPTPPRACEVCEGLAGRHRARRASNKCRSTELISAANSRVRVYCLLDRRRGMTPAHLPSRLARRWRRVGLLGRSGGPGPAPAAAPPRRAPQRAPASLRVEAAHFDDRKFRRRERGAHMRAAVGVA